MFVDKKIKIILNMFVLEYMETCLILRMGNKHSIQLLSVDRNSGLINLCEEPKRSRMTLQTS